MLLRSPGSLKCLWHLNHCWSPLSSLQHQPGAAWASLSTLTTSLLGCAISDLHTHTQLTLGHNHVGPVCCDSAGDRCASLVGGLFPISQVHSY